MKGTFAIATVSLFLYVGAHAANAAEVDDSAKVLAEQVCAVCHGRGGRSAYPTTPNLAAQPRQYLAGKLRHFRDRSLAKPESHIDVLGLSLMDDPMADALARYYANQPAADPIKADAALIAAGSKVYERGVPDKAVAPYGVCHGADAAGSWLFPRLAGQRAEYVERQLNLIQEHLRHSPLMHGIIKTMSAEDIKAVATFVQSK